MLTTVLSAPFSWLRFRIGMARYRRRYRNFCPTPSDDAVVHGIDDQVAYLTRLLDRGNIEVFLKRLAELNCKLKHEPLWGRALYLPELDELTLRAGLIFTPKPNLPADSKVVVHVATQVYSIGGHTRVMEDVVEGLPEYRHVLILTDMSETHSELVSLRPRFAQLSLEVRSLRSTGWTERARELSHLVADLAPEAIFLLAGHHDSVAYVVISGFSAPRVVLLHQSDHIPSLGATRRDYTHVDLTPACHKLCSSRPGLQALMLNLTVKEHGRVEPTHREAMVGATCGSPHKYAGSSEFSYAQLLAALFSAGVGEIFHIGDMPQEQKNQIRAEIAANAQDGGRVVFLPNTPSLAAKLIELSPNFYLVSHPIVGGKATVEALSVGLPILHARPASGLPLLTGDMTFGASVIMHSLEEAPPAVFRLKAEAGTLADRSGAAYEKHYSPAAFRQMLLSVMERPSGVNVA